VHVLLAHFALRSFLRAVRVVLKKKFENFHYTLITLIKEHLSPLKKTKNELLFYTISFLLEHTSLVTICVKTSIKRGLFLFVSFFSTQESTSATKQVKKFKKDRVV